MSETALCTAVVNCLRSEFNPNTPRCIDVRPDGRPTSAITSDVFVAVWSAGWNASRMMNNYIDEIHSIGVTVSLKTHKDHIDYWGLRTNMPWEQSLSYTVRRIIGAIHQQPKVLIDANALLETQVSSGFVEMLSFQRVEAKREQGPKWWGTETTAQGRATNPVVGWSQSIMFSGARRIQNLGVNEYA